MSNEYAPQYGDNSEYATDCGYSYGPKIPGPATTEAPAPPPPGGVPEPRMTAAQKAHTVKPAAAIPGWEGTTGPTPSQYHQDHVYARDVYSTTGACLCGRPLSSVLHPAVTPAWPSEARVKARRWLYATIVVFAAYVIVSVLIGPGYGGGLLGGAAMCYATRSYFRGWADRAELDNHWR